MKRPRKKRSAKTNRTAEQRSEWLRREQGRKAEHLSFYVCRENENLSNTQTEGSRKKSRRKRIKLVWWSAAATEHVFAGEKAREAVEDGSLEFRQIKTRRTVIREKRILGDLRIHSVYGEIPKGLGREPGRPH